MKLTANQFGPYGDQHRAARTPPAIAVSRGTCGPNQPQCGTVDVDGASKCAPTYLLYVDELARARTQYTHNAVTALSNSTQELKRRVRA